LGRVEYIGQEVEQVLGYSSAEIEALPVVNMLLPWLSAHPGHGPDYVQYLKDVHATGKPMSAINLAITKSGEVRWIQLSARPVAYHEDGTFSLDGIILDITAQVEKQALSERDHCRDTQERKSNAFVRRLRILIHDVANSLVAARIFAELVVGDGAFGSDANRHAGRILEACDEAAATHETASSCLRATESDGFAPHA
jgi:PAS domain S-box-containing protein